MNTTRALGFISILMILCMRPVEPALPADAQGSRFVDGDPWITSNAYHTGRQWESLQVGRAAFGLQLSAANDLPFDRGTAGATFWVRQASCTNPFNGFGNRCGWQLGLAITQFRSIVVGGHANVYADFSGVDVADRASWIAGIDVAQDNFRIDRLAAGVKLLPDRPTSLRC